MGGVFIVSHLLLAKPPGGRLPRVLDGTRLSAAEGLLLLRNREASSAEPVWAPSVAGPSPRLGSGYGLAECGLRAAGVSRGGGGLDDWGGGLPVPTASWPRGPVTTLCPVFRGGSHSPPTGHAQGHGAWDPVNGARRASLAWGSVPPPGRGPGRGHVL